jgi:hypothetical protein
MRAYAYIAKKATIVPAPSASDNLTIRRVDSQKSQRVCPPLSPNTENRISALVDHVSTEEPIDSIEAAVLNTQIGGQ